MGRFISADAYTSTGQGLLGNNMFAYCNNNPVNCADASGTSCTLVANPKTTFYEDTSGGGGGGAVAMYVGELIFNTMNTVSNSPAVWYTAWGAVYAYAHVVIDQNAGRYENQQPRVHHVIPRGMFSHFGSKYVEMMTEMHEMLDDAGININDPQNLVIISHGTHKSMHTQVYIEGIYAIMMYAKGGDRDDVLFALFFARQYAASWDKYANGY